VYTYRAYGLLIASDVALPLPPAAGGEPDVVLRRGVDRPVPEARPGTERLAEVLRADGSIFFTLGRSASGTVLRYPGLCDFAGDRTLAEVSVHLAPGADEGLLSVMISGTLLAVHLMLRHAHVLHASAVHRDGRALAFVGSSGMGKSTVSAALCEVGCDLISDDLLRVDKAGQTLLVHPGGTESRLRPSARSLAAAVPAGSVRETADGRLALRPRTWTGDPLPLAACVVPRPDRGASRVSVRRLRPSIALLSLSRYPRVLGWSDPASAAAAFQALADLVERVPVFEATIPWGLPFADGVLTDLLDALPG
jgi:hypothetical protein